MKLTRLNQQIRNAFNQNNFDKVIAVYQHAKACTDVDVLYIIAYCYSKKGLHEEAVLIWEKILTYEFNTAVDYNLGIDLKALNRFEEAIDCFKQVLTCEENVGAYVHLINILITTKQYRQAEHFINLSQHLSQDIVNLKLDILVDTNRLEEALTFLSEEETIFSYVKQGSIYHRLKNYDKAEYFFKKVMSMSSDKEEEQYLIHCAEYYLGDTFLSQGRYSEGFPLKELRFGYKDVNRLVLPFPMWKGEDLVGKSIILVAEQGSGDQIQFCRYFKHVEKLGPTQLTIGCPSNLKRLFDSSFSYEILEKVHSSISYDYWTYYPSIPAYLPIDVPKEVPYLKVDPALVEKWRNILPKGFLVGLVWKGSPTHLNDKDRSLKDLSILYPLWENCATFVCLQIDNVTDQEKMSTEFPICKYDVKDFADSAAIIENLNLVIAIDSSIINLVGALGKKGWVMLSKHYTDWRWGTDDWYPTVTKFCQQTDGDWSTVVQEMSRELKQLRTSVTSLRCP